MKNALILLLLASNAALADDAAVLKCRALPDAASRLSCYDAMPLAGAPAPAVAPAVASEQNFGLRPAAQRKPAAQRDVVRSTVVGEIGGWSPGTRITLANGQVWRVVDGDAVLPMMRNPQAEVSRGLMGAYFLQVAGHTSAARVARVQ
jgi:hypothetical protein